MSNSELIPSLFLFTLIAVALIAIVLLVRFMRKPQNRHPMDGQRERSVDEMRDEAAQNRQ